ncbi:DUF6531 domain-containing protein [Pseudomonas solani]|uniref:DUF6531 domain-containing protein n=1 Tax=Pseudomonas solani TaxID=2731552 RepID=UPI0035BE7F3F
MRKYLLPLLLLACSNNAFALYGYDYIWEIWGWGGWGPLVENPEAGCRGGEHTTSEGQVFIYRGYRFVRPDAVECIFTYITPDGVNQGERAWLPLSVYRFGDGCTGGRIYDPTKLKCTTPDASAGSLCQDQSGATAGNPLLKQIDGSCKSLSRSPSQKGYEAGPSCGATAGNPINFASGNKIQTELDFTVQGSSPLALQRTYNSIDGFWRHNYSANLSAGTSFALITLPDGKEIYFQVSGDQARATREGVGELSKIAGVWEYTAPDNRRMGFDSQGRLSYAIQPSGERTTLSYGASAITLQDDAGNSLALTEDEQHQPTRLAGDSIEIQYTYDYLSRLTKLTRTLNGQVSERTYHYDPTPGSRLLSGITDERDVRYATWTYDDQGRAISSEHAGGAERTLVSYNADGSSTVTNALGKRTTYRFQTIQGVRRITAIEGEPSANCPNSNSTYTYNERGLVKSRTDNKGNVTIFDYNDRGLEVSRTEAFGTPQARTVTTAWHPTFSRPIRVTEPERTTNYNYNDQGNLISQHADEI